MNEAETRAEHIDPALKAAGWGVVQGSRVRREHAIVPGRIEGKGKHGKSLTADYVLEYRNTKLAVVEAKAWIQALTEGVAQAKNYAGKLAIRYTYSSNGHGIYAIDMRTGKEGQTLTYPTPDELWQMTFPKPVPWRNRFAAVPTPDKSGTWSLRFYQEIAVNRVLEAIENGKDRALLTLATGTGKTSIAFQIAWKLFNARWNLTDWKSGAPPTRHPRILFLADQAFKRLHLVYSVPRRRAGADQPRRYQEEGQGAEERQHLPNLYERSAERRQAFPVLRRLSAGLLRSHHHRRMPSRGANDESTWRDILEYSSPAVQLGLTATPKRQENADTYA